MRPLTTSPRGSQKPRIPCGIWLWDSTTQLHEKQEEVRQRVESTLETAKAFTRENPVMAAGIAFVAGALVASLMRR
jgi:ElaB/YqjD/DUF883 family membrane-anchored ribosome-binding protein